MKIHYESSKHAPLNIYPMDNPVYVPGHAILRSATGILDAWKRKPTDITSMQTAQWPSNMSSKLYEADIARTIM